MVHWFCLHGEATDANAVQSTAGADTIGNVGNDGLGGRARRAARRHEQAAAQLSAVSGVHPDATEHEPSSDDQRREVDDEQEEREASAVLIGERSSDEAGQEQEAHQGANEERKEELGTIVEHGSSPSQQHVDKDHNDQVDNHRLKGLHFLKRARFSIARCFVFTKKFSVWNSQFRHIVSLVGSPFIFLSTLSLKFIETRLLCVSVSKPRFVRMANDATLWEMRAQWDKTKTTLDIGNIARIMESNEIPDIRCKTCGYCVGHLVPKYRYLIKYLEREVEKHHLRPLETEESRREMCHVVACAMLGIEKVCDKAALMNTIVTPPVEFSESYTSPVVFDYSGTATGAQRKYGQAASVFLQKSTQRNASSPPGTPSPAVLELRKSVNAPHLVYHGF